MNKHVNKNKPVKRRADYGDTPVMVSDPVTEVRPPGLRQQILLAASRDEIQALLNEGANFKNASPKTARQWIRTANLRAKQLGENGHFAAVEQKAAA